MHRPIALVGLGFVVASAAAFPSLPSAPKASDFLSVEQAAVASLRAPNGAASGLTSYLGVNLTNDAAGRLVVDGVDTKSPAERAGMKINDLVTHVAGNPVANVTAFREWVQSYQPNESIKLIIVRAGKAQEITAKLEPTSRPLKPSSAYFGMRLAQEFKEGDGARVESVSDGSPAATAGFKVGDVLIKLNNEEITRASALNDLIQEKKPGDEITIVVKRDGKELQPIKALLTAQPSGFAGGRGGPRGGIQTLSLWTKPELRVLIVGIDFSDIKHNERHTPEALERLFVTKADAGTNTLSLHDYMSEISAGALHLKGKAAAWVEVAKKRSEYSQGTGVSNKTAVLVDALEKLTTRDGKDALANVDALIFVYAGEAARTNRGAVYYPHAGIVRRTREAPGLPYLLVPEGGAKLSALNAFAKESCLLLGLPDLAARTENVGSEGLGNWCILSDVKSNGRPQHLSAWGKERLGWLKPTVIDPTMKQKLALAPIEGSAKECFKVLVRPDGSEYLLLENRKRKGFDVDLPGEGLLIWRVANGKPTLLESHGVEGPTGPTLHHGLVPYPSSANTALTPNTIPSSRSPQGGGLPVNITNIKRQPDGRITFLIGFEFE